MYMFMQFSKAHSAVQKKNVACVLTPGLPPWKAYEGGWINGL
jgi:hypothetical protein